MPTCGSIGPLSWDEGPLPITDPVARRRVRPCQHLTVRARSRALVTRFGCMNCGAAHNGFHGRGRNYNSSVEVQETAPRFAKASCSPSCPLTSMQRYVESVAVQNSVV